MTLSASDYSGYHVGRWRAGQRPTVDKVLAVVIYDQKYDAYIIDYQDKYDFQEWVCGEWFEDYDLETEEPVEFLEHNDVYVKFTNLGDIA
tara:strand:- start:238 stop:507 length:270 start_codon:yes stop_codon:yes gene_type:complete